MISGQSSQPSFTSFISFQQLLPRGKVLLLISTSVLSLGALGGCPLSLYLCLWWAAWIRGPGQCPLRSSPFISTLSLSSSLALTLGRGCSPPARPGSPPSCPLTGGWNFSPGWRVDSATGIGVLPISPTSPTAGRGGSKSSLSSLAISGLGPKGGSWPP